MAVITGAGRGIGRAIALGFAEEGAEVVVVDRILNNASKVADETKTLGHEAIALRTDVSQKKDVEEILEASIKRFGRVDILVNNAAIVRSWRTEENLELPAEEFPEEDWDEIMDVNLKGTFLCCQVIGRQMIKQGGGNIINISSLAGLIPQVVPRPTALAKRA